MPLLLLPLLTPLPIQSGCGWAMPRLFRLQVLAKEMLGRWLCRADAAFHSIASYGAASAPAASAATAAIAIVAAVAAADAAATTKSVAICC